MNGSPSEPREPTDPLAAEEQKSVVRMNADGKPVRVEMRPVKVKRMLPKQIPVEAAAAEGPSGEGAKVKASVSIDILIISYFSSRISIKSYLYAFAKFYYTRRN